MAKRYSKSRAKQVEKQIKKLPTWVIVTAFVLAIIIGAGYYLYITYFKKEEYIPPVGELEFHFLALGNRNNGDCIYVRAGDNDILIDAGSKESSIPYIQDYLDDYVTDNVLEYVVVTHADSDHIVGFSKPNGSIFDLYECKTIIDFAQVKEEKIGKETYTNYIAERTDEVAAGAKHYTALQCWNETDGAKRVYTLSDSVNMEIMYNYYYENVSSDENNHSVCIMFNHGSRKFLFTGDLEKSGEEKFVEYYGSNLTQVELFKAGHHGSKTSSNDCLLDLIKPKICVVSCCAGYNEFHAKPENIFPTQSFIDRISEHTTNVYVTRVVDEQSTDGYKNLNGDIKVISKADKEVYVEASVGTPVKLKDTDWYKQNRTSEFWD